MEPIRWVRDSATSFNNEVFPTSAMDPNNPLLDRWSVSSRGI